MPRTAASSVGIATGRTTRLKPPPGLTAAERETFLAIVMSCRADHFQEHECYLLVAYCRACCREQTAADELAASGLIDSDGKPSVYLGISKEATRVMTVLSSKLRLNPLSRLPSAQSEPEKISHYERMALLERHDDAN